MFQRCLILPGHVYSLGMFAQPMSSPPGGTRSNYVEQQTQYQEYNNNTIYFRLNHEFNINHTIDTTFA